MAREQQQQQQQLTNYAYAALYRQKENTQEAACAADVENGEKLDGKASSNSSNNTSSNNTSSNNIDWPSNALQAPCSAERKTLINTCGLIRNNLFKHFLLFNAARCQLHVAAAAAVAFSDAAAAARDIASRRF